MNRRYEIGALILRVAVGITFFLHGLAKFQGGIEETGMFFSSLGIPSFLAYIIAVIELIGGIAMIIGLGTRIVAILFVFTMIGAIFTAKRSVGFLGGFELEFILLFSALSLAFTGSHYVGIDSFKNKKEKGN